MSLGIIRSCGWEPGGLVASWPLAASSFALTGARAELCGNIQAASINMEGMPAVGTGPEEDLGVVGRAGNN